VKSTGSDRLRDSGVVEQNVQTAEARNREVDEVLDVIRVGDVGAFECDRRAELLRRARHPRPR
jgi:hypothetical protein